MGFREEIIKRVEKATDLPPLPGVFLKLDKIMADNNSSATDIASVMRDDVALTARVLRVANSAAFGGTIKITSVSQAVARFGFRQLADLVKSMSLLGLFKGGGSVDIKQFWLHSLCVASTSELAPRYLGRMAQNSESLFTAGLLHDVGILVMELFTGDLYRSVVTMSVDTNQPLLQTEKKLMQIDHAEVGGLVLAKWGIPEVIADAAARHHTPFKPSEGALPLSDAIQFANLICNDNGIANGTGTVLAKITEAEWSEFSFQTANLPSLKEEIQKVVVRCSSMLAAS